jgi:pimeloyl-ACP methyl ester carboxylesterase
MPAPVIMVHGAFCGGWVFDRFRAPFESAGHRCLAPDLPGHEPGQGASAVCGQSMAHYANAVVDLIDACEAPPVLIGHSLGGLVAQMAATRRPVRNLILLAPSAPWGVPGGSMEEAAAVIGLMSLGAYWTQAIAPDAGLARSYSLDRLSSAEREAAVARMVHESGRALWETFQWWMDPFMTTSVSPGRIKAPVLALAGGADHIHPPAAVRQTAARLGAAFRAYDGMSHWLIGEPGYEEVAQDCLAWLRQTAKVAA